MLRERVDHVRQTPQHHPIAARHTPVSGLQFLQRAVGNAAVGTLIARTRRAGSPSPTVQALKADEGDAPPAPAAVVGEEQAVASVTTLNIPDVTTAEGAGRDSGAAIEGVEDRPSSGRPNVVANIVIEPSSTDVRTDRAGGKADPVVSGVSIGAFSQPGGRGVSPFGAEFYEPAFTGVTAAFAGGNCTITAKLDPICPWGTNGGGKTDVPSADAAVVTKTSWPEVKSDLTPRTTTPFKSPRTKYYSQSLVERHERFHGTDDRAWTTSSGLGIVKARLEAGNVTPGNAAEVTALVDAARKKLIAENLTWYTGGGAAHDSYAGEIRAYADGRAAYQTLGDAVGARAATEKWAMADGEESDTRLAGAPSESTPDDATQLA